jgi:HK97 family phage major capsid protein
MDNIQALAEQNLRMNGARLLDSPLPAASWEDLLAAETTIADASEKIIAMAENNGRRLAGAEQEAIDLSVEVLKNIRREKSARDSAGNRQPRSATGRVTRPSDPMGGDGLPGYSGATLLGRPKSNRARDVFGAALGTGTGGFKSFNEFFRTVSGNPMDQRLIRNFGGENETEGTEGGFMVPPEFIQGLWDAALEDEIVRPRATVYPAKSNMLVIGKVDVGGDHSGGSIAGLKIQWAQEEEQLTSQKVRIVPENIRVNKGVIYVPCSNELLEDATSSDAWISEVMIAALSFHMDYAFLFGNGAGTPLGVLNSPSLIVVAKESSQSTATVIGANLLSMMGRLHPSCEKTAIWVVSPSVRQQLYTTSQEQGVDMPGVNRTVTSVGTNLFIMGRPVVCSEKLPTLGTQGDIVLCDFDEYLIALRQEIRLEKSMHEKFGTDQTTYRLKIRAGGQGQWAKAITPRGGGATLSWAVTLAVRP